MKKLCVSKEVAVRFNEVDSLRIVWHGHYVKYLEEAREAFGNDYAIGYCDVENAGYATPIVKVDIDYKRQLRYGDIAVVEATYVDSPAAKLIFDYVISRKSNNEIIATARTIQVFLFLNTRELSLNTPDFMLDWKTKNGF
ncbi:MAG: acyl-CoA thioesterase [Bacteroidales bacterium]|nr:acyl-CoA thioesterase [Bacteroidales bacterium]